MRRLPWLCIFCSRSPPATEGGREKREGEEGCKSRVAVLTPACDNSHFARSHRGGFGSWAWTHCCPWAPPVLLRFLGQCMCFCNIIRSTVSPAVCTPVTLSFLSTLQDFSHISSEFQNSVGPRSPGASNPAGSTEWDSDYPSRECGINHCRPVDKIAHGSCTCYYPNYDSVQQLRICTASW